ncbi:topless-related protein 2-like [Raphanus sativus]|uniref:Topless-related protein 2-like n=1 Tax=Raphanus sativus TaxID=3726 RepID=A0A6J0LV54_RAPSA|nr:topless-related protein 2-like [Raphanus sativus]
MHALFTPFLSIFNYKKTGAGFWFFSDSSMSQEKYCCGWDEVMIYLSGLIRSMIMEIFFEIRKPRNDKAKVIEILAKDLKVLATCKEKLYKEMRSINF